MATRNLAKQSVNADECTTFQLHKSQRTAFNGFRHKVFDFAEYRLRRLADRSRSGERRNFILDLIDRYRKGEVMIAWQLGEPVYINVTREA